MTDFVSIKDAKVAKKGSIVGSVIRVGELKSGTKNGDDWSRKTITLQDNSGDTVELTVWNEEIDQFNNGGVFSLANPYWTEYKDKLNLSLGKYCTVQKVESAKTQETMDKPAVAESPPAVGEPVDVKSLPEMNANLLELVNRECVIMLQIEKEVRQTMQEFLPKVLEVNQQKLGMFVKEIYRTSRLTNFKKASDEQ